MIASIANIIETNTKTPVLDPRRLTYLILYEQREGFIQPVQINDKTWEEIKLTSTKELSIIYDEKLD